MYNKIEHEYNKSEIDIVLNIINAIKNNNFKNTTYIKIKGENRNIEDTLFKCIILRKNKSFECLSMSNGISYDKDHDITIIELNSEFIDKIDIIEKLLME